MNEDIMLYTLRQMNIYLSVIDIFSIIPLNTNLLIILTNGLIYSQCDRSPMPSYLGQNFLKDSTYTILIAQKVAQLCDDLQLEQCIEIGPGKWALTKKLVKIINKPLVLLEKDETLVPYLQNLFPHIAYHSLSSLDTTTEKTSNTLSKTSPAAIQSTWEENISEYLQIDLLLGDALTLNTASLLEQKWRNPSKTIVVGNLPYYITSPLITKFFWWGNAIFPAGVFMVQKEVADKIRTDADKKSFLWRLLNYQYTVKYLKTVPAKAFSPAPKVQSAVFSLVQKPTLPTFSYEEMVFVLDKISKYKRKTLGKCWKMAELGEKYPLPVELAGKRLEEIGLEEMKMILS